MEWVTRENIKRFERLLEAERDPVDAARLKVLLAEETKKLHNSRPPSCITAIVRSMISPGGMSALLNTDPFSAAGRGLPLTAANKPLEHNGRGALPIPWPPTTYRQVSLRVAIFRVASSGSLVTTKPSSRSI
jgi:hypothetical protein